MSEVKIQALHSVFKHINKKLDFLGAHSRYSCKAVLAIRPSIEVSIFRHIALEPLA